MLVKKGDAYLAHIQKNIKLNSEILGLITSFVKKFPVVKS